MTPASSPNTAFYYGGAIACEAPYETRLKPKVKIFNTSFSASTAIHDAGGAVYLKTSMLDAANVNVTGLSLRFGGAFTLLNTYATLNRLRCLNNTASCDGGAIYFMYANISLTDSQFTDNHAQNGGALFINSAYYGLVENNTFEKNTANKAGAYYSLLNDYFLIKNNTYTANHAVSYDDLYETYDIDQVISGNSTMIQTDSYEGDIPSYYSMIDECLVTPFKNQQSTGNCWAFSAIAALESAILKATGIELDLSDNNLKNIMQKYSVYGWSKFETNEGAYLDTALGYFPGWLGPVLESDDIFSDMSALSPVLDSLYHIQNMLFLSRENVNDNDAIKKAVLNYGGVLTGIHSSGSSNQYYTGSDINHAVVIVGWDDNYSRNHFSAKPPADGAWICRNSWDPDWGYDGYFYVSYYDKSIAKPGKLNSAIAFVLNSTIKYDKNYQYDISGKTDFFIQPAKSIWYRNEFTSTDDEYLAAVSTYFEKTTERDLSVYVNGHLEHTQSGKSDAGYYTIDLTQIIPLKNGDVFEIAFKVTQNYNASFPVSEFVSLNNRIYKENISFISFNGINWYDLYEYEYEFPDHTYSSQVACIKAFTLLNPIQSEIKLNVSYDGHNPVKITAHVFNEWGNPVSAGEVEFNFDGITERCKLIGGVCEIVKSFAEGLNNISATFAGKGYESSSDDASLIISKIRINPDLTYCVNMDTLDLKIILPDDFKGEVKVNVVGRNYTFNALNGRIDKSISNLLNGHYTAEVYVLSDKYCADLKSFDFDVTALKTQIRSDNLTAYYRSGVFTVMLADENNIALSNRDVSFTINAKTYHVKTDKNGKASLDLDLVNGAYDVLTIFNGDSTYFASSAINRITVRSTIAVASLKYTYNSRFTPVLSDSEGNPLINTKVAITLADSKTYYITTDKSGRAGLAIGLKPGSYKMSVLNPATGEVKSMVINVLKRISENANMNFYYGALKSYSVRVFDDYGNQASGVYVKISVCGKAYTVKSDSKGYASLKINLKPKTYQITAEYKGYKVSNKIIIKPTLITSNMQYKKSYSYKYYAKLLDTGGRALKNKIIYFKFKGRTFSARTSSFGYAIIYLKYNLPIGKHYITTCYGKMSATNTIIIKR